MLFQHSTKANQNSQLYLTLTQCKSPKCLIFCKLFTSWMLNFVLLQYKCALALIHTSTQGGFKKLKLLSSRTEQDSRKCSHWYLANLQALNLNTIKKRCLGWYEALLLIPAFETIAERTGSAEKMTTMFQTVTIMFLLQSFRDSSAYFEMRSFRLHL